MFRRPVPPAPVVVSKDTTFFTEPLDANGHVDYIAALNQIAGEGIRADENAYARLWSVWGPAARIRGNDPASPEIVEQTCNTVGIDVPPSEGVYFIGLEDYLRSLSESERREAFSPVDPQGEND